MGTNFNFNRAILGGRLTSDIELKQTQSGTPVCTFTIAINRKRAKDGEQQSDFISCVAFKERAELISKYFRKGSSICIVGEIQTRKWQDSNGNNRFATEVIVNEVNFVDSKSDNTTASTPTYMPDAYKTPSFEANNGDDDNLPF
jgi:single-strand DNA-binding protein